MNNGYIKLFADHSEVSTFNNGKIDEMLGKAMISANMDGEIGYQDKQTIILYSPKESEKRMNEYRQIKEKVQGAAAEKIEQAEEKTEVKEEEKTEVAAEKPKRKTKQQQLKIKLD